MQAKETQTNLWQTLGNALALKPNFYENARSTEHNHRITITIVTLAATSHAIGSALILLINRASPSVLVLALLIDVLSIGLGYYFWTLTIWQIGRWLKRFDLTYGDLLVPIGFAYAPQVLNFLTVIPLLGRFIELILAAWSLLAVIIAVRQGLDIKTSWAIAICLVGWPIIQIAVGLVQLLEQALLELPI